MFSYCSLQNKFRLYIRVNNFDQCSDSQTGKILIYMRLMQVYISACAIYQYFGYAGFPFNLKLTFTASARAFCHQIYANICTFTNSTPTNRCLTLCFLCVKKLQHSYINVIFHLNVFYYNFSKKRFCLSSQNSNLHSPQRLARIVYPFPPLKTRNVNIPRTSQTWFIHFLRGNVCSGCFFMMCAPSSKEKSSGGITASWKIETSARSE